MVVAGYWKMQLGSGAVYKEHAAGGRIGRMKE